jgi:hypothetical protein
MGIPVLAASLLLAIAGCTRQPESPFRAGQSAFQFDHAKVTQLEIAKNDPSSGDAWNATLEKVGPDPADWEIRSASVPLVDQKADGAFVLHLLDTLRTVRLDSPSPAGGSGDGGKRAGLDPPRFALRWKLATGAGSHEELELRIGAAGPQGRGAHAIPVPGTSASGARAASEAWLVSGATLPMLDVLTGFDALRYRKWIPLASDDVDEIELKSNGKTWLYAQRHGNGWADRKLKPLRRDVQALLDGLTHLRVQAFLDDPAEATRIADLISKNPLAEAVLTDRAGKPTLAKAVRGDGGKLYGWVSSRPGAAFELYPRALDFLAPSGR